MMKNFHKVRGKREFLFDDRELFVLGGGAVIICTLIFILGVMVGQSLEEQSVAGPLVTDNHVFDNHDMLPEQSQDTEEPGLTQEEPASAGDAPGMKTAEKSYFTVLPDQETYVEVEATPVRRSAPEEPSEGQPQATPVVQQDNPAQHVAAKEETPVPPANSAAAAVPTSQTTVVAATLPNVPKNMSDDIQVGRPQKVGGLDEPTFDGTVYAVQVASSPAREDSERLVKKFAQHGYQAYIMEANLGEKGVWYRVCVGSNLTSRDAANQLRDELVRKVPQLANKPFVTKISE